MMRNIRVFLAFNSFRQFHASTFLGRRGYLLRNEITTPRRVEQHSGFEVTDNYATLENNDDVFGIESDEGAIFVEASELNLEKYKELVVKVKEVEDVTVKTTFGHIRLDSDNEKKIIKPSSVPKTAANQKSELNFDNGAKKIKQESENSSSKIEINLESQSEYTHSNSSSNSSHRINYVHQSQTALNVLSQSEAVQKIVLPSQESNQSAMKDSYQTKSNNQSTLSTEFEKLNISNQLDSELSYIDQSYFVSDSETNNVIKDFQDHAKSKEIEISEPSKKFEGYLDSSNLGFIDEMYFNESNPQTDDATKAEIKHESRVELDITNNADTSFKSEEQENSDFDKQYFGSYMENQPKQNMQTTKESEKFENTFGETPQILFDKNENVLHRFNNILPGRNKNRFRWPLVNDSELESDSLESNVMEEDSKDSIKIPSFDSRDKSLPEAKVEEYAKKLKEERISKFTSAGEFASGIKLDSKGFRILSSQVPDLSKLTQHELMSEMKTRILFSDNDILILDKPYNLVVHDSETNKEPNLECILDELARSLDNQSSNPKLYTVHRLDKTTTGCILLARNEMSAQHLKSLFVQRKITKTYWIVTSGVPEHDEGTIDIPIAEGTIGNKSRMVLSPRLEKDMQYRSKSKHGKSAITRYSVISSYGNAALIEATSETGLKHQIRVHFGFGLNCPIIGDHKYSSLTKLVPQKLPSDILQRLKVRQSKVRHIPMHIHARRIMIPNYLDGKHLFISAPLPRHMRENLQSLKIRKK